MLKPVIAVVPPRGGSRLEFLGTIERPTAGGAAVLSKGTVPQILDVLDIAVATTLHALFAAIKR